MKTIVENFQKGDLLYGLKDQRKMYVPLLQEKVGTDTAITVDEYNAIIIARLLNDKECYDEKNITVCQFLYWLDRPDFKLEPACETKLSSVAIKQHLEAIRDVASYPKVSISNNIFPPRDHKLDREGRKTRRACKARMLDPKITIHFLLDNLNPIDIFNKPYSQMHQDVALPKYAACAYDTYTSAEMRFVLKHYEEVKSHIKFYMNGLEVSLMNWISQQMQSVKHAILAWATDRWGRGKLHADTLGTLRAAVMVAPLEVKEEKAAMTTPVKKVEPEQRRICPPTPARPMVKPRKVPPILSVVVTPAPSFEERKAEMVLSQTPRTP